MATSASHSTAQQAEIKKTNLPSLLATTRVRSLSVTKPPMMVCGDRIPTKASEGSADNPACPGFCRGDRTSQDFHGTFRAARVC
jgi:hypothetical protein